MRRITILVPSPAIRPHLAGKACDTPGLLHARRLQSLLGGGGLRVACHLGNAVVAHGLAFVHRATKQPMLIHQAQAIGCFHSGFVRRLCAESTFREAATGVLGLPEQGLLDRRCGVLAGARVVLAHERPTFAPEHNFIPLQNLLLENGQRPVRRSLRYSRGGRRAICRAIPDHETEEACHQGKKDAGRYGNDLHVHGVPRVERSYQCI